MKVSHSYYYYDMKVKKSATSYDKVVGHRFRYTGTSRKLTALIKGLRYKGVNE